MKVRAILGAAVMLALLNLGDAFAVTMDELQKLSGKEITFTQDVVSPGNGPYVFFGKVDRHIGFLPMASKACVIEFTSYYARLTIRAGAKMTIKGVDWLTSFEFGQRDNPRESGWYANNVRLMIDSEGVNSITCIKFGDHLEFPSAAEVQETLGVIRL